MILTWILAAAAVVAMAATGGGILLYLGRLEGRVTALLSQLVDIARDHEHRIRAAERHQARCPGARR